MKRKYLLVVGVSLISEVLRASALTPCYECNFENFPELLSKTFLYDGTKPEIRVELGRVNAQVYVNDGEILHLRIGEKNELPIPKFVQAIGYGLPPQMHLLYFGETGVSAVLTCTRYPGEAAKNETIPLRQFEIKNKGTNECPDGTRLCYTAWGKIPYCATRCED